MKRYRALQLNFAGVQGHHSTLGSVRFFVCEPHFVLVYAIDVVALGGGLS